MIILKFLHFFGLEELQNVFSFICSSLGKKSRNQQVSAWYIPGNGLIDKKIKTK